MCNSIMNSELSYGDDRFKQVRVHVLIVYTKVHCLADRAFKERFLLGLVKLITCIVLLYNEVFRKHLTSRVFRCLVADLLSPLRR